MSFYQTLVSIQSVPMKLKNSVTSLRQLQIDAAEAEKEPGRILEHLQEEAKNTNAIRQQERIGKISNNARSAWAESLHEIRAEGQVHELIRREDDPDFNARFVDPILTKSAEEYGRLVTELTRLGAEDLPKELAKGLSKMVQLAHASSVAIAARDAMQARLEEIESTADRVNNLFRPQVGGGVPKGPGAKPAPTAMTPQEAGAALAFSVLQRK
jgi:hypothetical protein